MKTCWKLMLNTMKRGPPYTKADSQQLKHYLDARFFIYLKLTGNLTKLIKNLLETYDFFWKVIETYKSYWKLMTNCWKLIENL